MPQYIRLRDLIRNIRLQKTMANERNVVQKELAVIRTAFKEEDTEFRTRNVAKVLYIHMLGYPTHFAQLECLKLIASPKFGDKRIGYLGAMLLLDERSDVQMLLTNSLKMDMNASNQYVCCLALTTLANICSAEMARDLASEVEKLLKSSNALIRKKAALCCYRIIKKVPELQENFAPSTRAFLNERSHGVLLTGLVLANEVCQLDNQSLQATRRLVPTLAGMLKTLVLSGNSPDYDVGSVPDPFLQVKLIELLGVLGQGSTQASQSMGDVLAMVATNTEASGMVGNAVLYETARTIIKIKADSGLRVLAINILGRFLQHSDRNIRYVALNALLHVVHGDLQAVQRHSTTIVDCLKDSDVSIRRRALELVLALMNKNNIRVLMKEVLAMLDVAESDTKSYMCTAIAHAAANHSPSRRWQLDTLLRMVVSAGTYVSEDLVAHVIRVVAEEPDQQDYITRRLYVAVQDDISQQPLDQIAVWCIGEYGDMLLAEGAGDDSVGHISDVDIIDLLETILGSSFCTQVTKEYVLTALAKLSVRLQTGHARIKGLLASQRASVDVELQQRAVEYTELFTNDPLRYALLEQMPEPDQSEGAGADDPTDSVSGSDRDSDSPGPGQEDAPVRNGPSRNEGRARVVQDKSMSRSPQQTQTGDLLDLLHASEQPSMAQPVGQRAGNETGPGVIAYQKNGVTITLQTEPQKGSTGLVHVTANMTNTSPSPATNVLFQVAVPKALKLQMEAANGTEMQPWGQNVITQLLRISNPDDKPIRLRLRISYVMDGNTVQDQTEVGPLL